MMSVGRYFSALLAESAQGWNRFWFRPRDPFAVCLLRIVVGVVALVFHASHTADLLRWFGPHGLLPIETAAKLNADAQFRWSLLSLSEHPAWLWSVHLVGFVVLLLFTVGLWTRATSVLTLIFVLSYVHRGTILAGELEPVLTMLLLYLCLAPVGSQLSLDWLRACRAGGAAKAEPSISANIGTRLIQLHLAGFYGMMGLTQLASETWWSGQAVWWLIAHSESRLVDLTSLHTTSGLYLVNAWTHAIVLFELSFVILIWNRLARPLLLAIAIPMWLSLLPITGLVAFCLLMLAANLIYIDPVSLRQLVRVETQSAATRRVKSRAG